MSSDSGYLVHLRTYPVSQRIWTPADLDTSPPPHSASGYDVLTLAVTPQLSRRQHILRNQADLLSLITCSSLKNQLNFKHRLTFLGKHLILFRGLKKPFSGILIQISGCRAFSPFETVPCRLIRSVEFQSGDNRAIL